MKPKLYSILLILLMAAGLSTQAQVNRREERKSVPYRANYQRMATGPCANHSLEIKEGYIWAWGNNSYGQLGDGTAIQRKQAVRINSHNNWVLVSTGGKHSAAIQANGTLWCWGYNNYGQLGHNTLLNTNIPTRVGADSNWISVACGNDFTLALKADGTLWAWGNNISGQLGDNTLLNKSIPTQIGTATNWVAIGAGYAHSMAVQANGTLWSWGSNNKGQAGTGNLTNHNLPVQVGNDSIWVSIAAGYEHNMAIKANGTLWAWGANDSAQLGDGTFQSKSTPTLIGSKNNWVSIAAGKYQSLAIQANGTLWACNSTYTTPTQISTAKNWVSIFAGNTHNIALQANGTLHAWGNNTYGQTGTGTLATITNLTPISNAPNGWLMLSVASGYTGIGSSMGIKMDGTLWAWGSNLNAQFGNGTLTASNYPVQIGTANNWVSVEITQSNTIALQADGTLWSWGRNNPNLGTGVSFDHGFQTTPVRIGMDSNWTSFNGISNVFGLKADGTLWFWGYTGNTPYYIDTSVTEITTPVQHNTDNNWVSVGQTGFYCLLKADGSLWAAGDNTFGQLGNGTNTNGTGNNLVRVGNINNKNWIKIAHRGYSSGLAMQANGSLWAWGNNAEGELGDGTTTNRNSPVQIGADRLWMYIKGPTGYACGGRAIAANGTLWAWGANDNGQYGNGYTGTWTVPTQVNNDNNWINVFSTVTYNIGLKAHRNGFCAVGDNSQGQLGDTTNNSTTIFNCELGAAPCGVPPAPLADNVQICAGTRALLNASGLGILSWYTDSVAGSLLAIGSNFTAPLLQNNTTYYVQDSTCFVSNKRQAVPVIILSRPKGGFTINNNVQCIQGNQFVFTDTSNMGKSNIKRIWSLGNTDTASLATVSQSYTITNAYTIQLVVYDTNYCTDTTTKTINVLASPQSGFIVNTVNQCVNNNNFIFTDTSTISTGTLNRSWQFGDGGTGINTDSIAHKKYGLANTYWVKLIIASENACKDSTLQLVTLYEKPKVKALASDTLICAGNSIILNGNGAKNYTWTDGIINGMAFIPTQSKSYGIIGIDSNTCTDTNTIHITVKPMPAITTTWSKPTITATQLNAAYQWLNCNNSFAPIGGANAQTYTPANNGSYAVTVNLNNCIDTSACVPVNGIGINEIKNTLLSIYPNPNKGVFTIHAGQQGEYKISNELGQTIQSFKTLHADNSTEIDISNQPNGIYFLHFTNAYTTYTYKLLKQ